MLRHHLVLALCCTFCLTAQAEGDSHCGPLETSLWSCSSKHKVYELCASRDLGKSTGYLQYRAGRIGKVELTYPPGLIHPRGVFKLHLYARNAGLTFRNERYEYQLFDALIGTSELRVFEVDGKLVRSISCEESNETFTNTQTINLFKEVGLYE